ncbi:hypothetical protein AAY473_014603 [Plecturocebus cupreus]
MESHSVIRLECSGTTSAHVEMRFHHVHEASLKLLTSSDPPNLASQSAGITVLKLEAIILSKLTQEQKTKHCMFSLISQS